ncbi:MAG: membrane protein insertion efficiency factor YidD [Elusimicrobia bacterium]|nr:membrane protein insertion efficiency factor YidD [Candidatus Liberimonas magnetica]
MKRILLYIITVYQKISSIGFAHCRFYPSCSCYTHEAVERYGVLTGTWLGFLRISRCHPFSKGGVDPVPEIKKCNNFSIKI